jgi:hypothetical protein
MQLYNLEAWTLLAAVADAFAYPVLILPLSTLLAGSLVKELSHAPAYYRSS